MLLQASGIKKLYGVEPVLDGINLQIQERDRVGLVGVNGAGKSTLLQILALARCPMTADKFLKPKRRPSAISRKTADCNPAAPSGKK